MMLDETLLELKRLAEVTTNVYIYLSIIIPIQVYLLFQVFIWDS